MRTWGPSGAGAAIRRAQAVSRLAPAGRLRDRRGRRPAGPAGHPARPSATADETSALNLVYLLGQDASTDSGAQPRNAPQLAGADEKWHIHGGNDQLITAILGRLPRGTLHPGHRLVAVRRHGAGYRCSFDRGGTASDLTGAPGRSHAR